MYKPQKCNEQKRVYNACITDFLADFLEAADKAAAAASVAQQPDAA